MSLSDLSTDAPAKRPPPAKKKRRTQAERTQGTRARILDAAVEVLRKKGYAYFRTADVARAAGVSRGAQLHHFATKEKLVYATMEHVFQNVLATSRRRVRPFPPRSAGGGSRSPAGGGEGKRLGASYPLRPRLRGHLPRGRGRRSASDEQD